MDLSRLLFANQARLGLLAHLETISKPSANVMWVRSTRMMLWLFAPILTFPGQGEGTFEIELFDAIALPEFVLLTTQGYCSRSLQVPVVREVCV